MFGQTARQVSSRIGALLQHYHPWLQSETDIQIDWNFFAASHSKGAADHIRDTIKRLGGRCVVTGKSIITDSFSFFNAVNNESKVKVFHVPTAEIKNQISEKSIKELLDNAHSLPGISKAHFFKILKVLSSSRHIETK